MSNVTTTGWEQANCQLALLLRVLPRRDWAVHRHDEAEMFAPKPDPGLDARTAQALHRAQGGLGHLHQTHNDTCTICLESVSTPSAASAGESKSKSSKKKAKGKEGKDAGLATLPCGHTFHAHCIAEWLKRSTGCPTCREPVTRTTIKRAEKKGKAAAPPSARRKISFSPISFAGAGRLRAKLGGALQRVRLPSLGRKKR